MMFINTLIAATKSIEFVRLTWPVFIAGERE
jgi:hypothetical protein